VELPCRDPAKAFGDSPVANGNRSLAYLQLVVGLDFLNSFKATERLFQLDLVKPLSTDIKRQRR